jgi:regulator of RNase E activity RraA
MAISTAQICDALVLNPAVLDHVKIFVSTFPIFSSAYRLEGKISVIEAGGDPSSRRAEIARLIDEHYIIVIDNYGRSDCACFEKSDLSDIKKVPLGVIVNGSLRNSSRFAEMGFSIRARSAHPMPYLQVTSDVDSQPAPKKFPYGTGAYVVGDGDSVIVMRSAQVLVDLGLGSMMRTAEQTARIARGV